MLSKSPLRESRWNLVIALMNRCSCMISESRVEKTIQFLPVWGETLDFESLSCPARSQATQRAPCWRNLLMRSHEEKKLPTLWCDQRNLKLELPRQSLLKSPTQEAMRDNNGFHFKPLSFRVLGYMAIANQSPDSETQSQVLWQTECLLFPLKGFRLTETWKS